MHRVRRQRRRLGLTILVTAALVAAWGLVDIYAGKILLEKNLVTLYEAVQEIWVAERDGELVGRLVRVVGGQLVEAVEHVAQLAHAVLDVAAHVLVGIELRLLLEKSDGRVGRELRVEPLTVRCVPTEL